MASKKPTTKTGNEVSTPFTKSSLVPNPFGMSFKTEAMGFQMAPDVFLVCQEIMETLYDSFEASMMRKRIDSEYKIYAVKNTIATAMYTINCSQISNDKGDVFNDDCVPFPPYNYEDESLEPDAPSLDNHGKSTVLHQPA